MQQRVGIGTSKGSHSFRCNGNQMQRSNLREKNRQMLHGIYMDLITLRKELVSLNLRIVKVTHDSAVYSIWALTGTLTAPRCG